MKPIQTLDEVQKYLMYLADALFNLSSSYSLDKVDSSLLEKYAEDLTTYGKNIEYLKNNLVMKSEMKKKVEVLSDLEATYKIYKQATTRAQTNVIVSKNYLQEISKSGSEKEIEAAKKRVENYIKQQVIAEQNEATAKREVEQGALNG